MQDTAEATQALGGAGTTWPLRAPLILIHDSGILSGPLFAIDEEIEAQRETRSHKESVILRKLDPAFSSLPILDSPTPQTVSVRTNLFGTFRSSSPHPTSWVA